jgi:hypothetical protein
MSSRFSLGSLTRQQRLVLGAALLTNVAILGILIWLVFSSTIPTIAPPPIEPNNAIECENNAALSLRQQGVSGSIMISGSESIQVYINGADAGAAWNVFSTTATLLNYGCGPYQVVRVDVPDPDQRSNTRLRLEVSWLDVQAWANDLIDDGQLSERMRRQVYQTQ